MEERLTTELAVEDLSSPANQETVEREFLIRFHWTDVQKFYNNSAVRAIERSSSLVEVSVDYRQTVTVGSFNKKLNLFTESSSDLMEASRQHLWTAICNTNLMVSMNFEMVFYVQST